MHTLRNYSVVEPKYIPAKNECLYDLTICKQSLDVFLLFLVKTTDVEAKGLRAKNRSKYCVPDILSQHRIEYFPTMFQILL
jgi:hypothetical protein